MKDTLFIGGLCLVIVVVGAALYFFEPEHGDTRTEGSVRFSVLTEGETAVNVDREANYRITSQKELEELWGLVYGTERPHMPHVDFDHEEVLAVFDGTHSSGGYEISVKEVIDDGLTRTVYITHTRPGEECVTASAITSPYEIVTLPKMREGLRLVHSDQLDLKDCR